MFCSSASSLDTARAANHAANIACSTHRNSSFGAQKNIGGLDTLVNGDGATYHFHRVWIEK